MRARNKQGQRDKKTQKRLVPTMWECSILATMPVTIKVSYLEASDEVMLILVDNASGFSINAKIPLVDFLKMLAGVLPIGIQDNDSKNFLH